MMSVNMLLSSLTQCYALERLDLCFFWPYEKNLVEVLNQLSYLIQHDREQDRLYKLAQKRG